ncbi:peptidyl-prolyl cis-trans isomerase [Clostridium estertheticum]|uniref:peptidyl-prolyl cis-trans isomerase n=1 Tax=Clostridium estertheticum TaxID=238834 RepID=UPI0013E90A89|nr:peptidyl-prolyl cis-trans isomerase [Clostridium estertheticum]MBZ9687859.1 peptidyl-prolyl cis-trans isomerase [Clostridium estertheticum]
MKFKKLIITVMIVTMGLILQGCSKGETTKTVEAPAKTVEEKTIVGEVDGKSITLADVYATDLKKKIKELKTKYGEDFATTQDAASKKAFNTSKEQYLNTIVEKTILFKKAAELKITPTEEALTTAVDARITESKANYETEAAFTADLATYGYTLDTLKVAFREQEIGQTVVKYLTKDVKITDEAIKKYYEANKETFVDPETVMTRHLLFKTEAEAKAIDAKIKNKTTTFDTLFKQYEGNKVKVAAATASPADKLLPISEDLGEVPKINTNYDPDFMAGLNTLTAGQVSSPVKSSFGYHIIEAKAIKASVKRTLDAEVTASIKAHLLNVESEKIYKAKIVEWKKEYNVKLFLDVLNK